MKKVVAFYVLILFAVCSFAQDISTIKTMATVDPVNAKAQLDKAMANQQFAAKPEAYALKTYIYSAVAIATPAKGTAQEATLMAEADASFKQYRKMDPSMSLVSDPLYQRGLLNIYTACYIKGYNDYTAARWEQGFTSLQKAVEYSDILIEKKLVTAKLDTNVLVLAGITAENSKHANEAARYYSRLADAHLTGNDYESVYRYLVNYYFVKKDMVNFEKYKALGKSLYPASEYFTYDKVDFTVGLETSSQGKVKSLEQLLVTDPDNYKANEILGELLFDSLYNAKTVTALSANAGKLEALMLAAFGKAAAAKPDIENAYMYMGNNFSIKAGFLEEKITKEPALETQYDSNLNAAREPYEKAAAIFAGKQNLSTEQKQQYKYASSYLSVIAHYNKTKLSLTAAERAKWVEVENKWNNVYDSIK